MGTSQLLSIRNTERITKLVKNSEAYRLQYIQISKKFLWTIYLHRTVLCSDWELPLVYYMLDTARINSSTVRQLQIQNLPLPEGKDKHPAINQVSFSFALWVLSFW